MFKASQRSKLIGRDIEDNQNGSFKALGSHPKLKIYALGLLFWSTGA